MSRLSDHLASCDLCPRLRRGSPKRQGHQAAKVVELRFFGGLEIDEVAQALDISTATVKRDWTVAKAWLRRELGGEGAPAVR